MELKPETELQTDGLRKIRVVRELGRGGQGIVYQVTADGKDLALKWYFETAIKNRKEFYKNLRKNIDIGAPASCFLWPLDSLRAREYNSFGYLMDIRPPEYVGMPRFLIRQQFDSIRARVDAMINITNGFRILHNQGFSYQDLNDGNFFINPHNGDVLICDNDNVSYPGYSTGILGKSRYMAPEIVIGLKQPDKATDRFSLALLLFELICKAHPLEGAGAMPPCMTISIEREIYGTHPVFIFDPKDNSNRPVRGVHNNAIRVWKELPDDLRKLFIQTFSKEAMTFHPDNNTYAAPRPIEREWLDVLIRFRNSIVPCACGDEVPTGTGVTTCPSCGRQLPVLASLQTARHTIPACPGVKILRMEIETCSDDEAILPVAEVIAPPGWRKNPDPYKYMVHNVSGETWHCTTSAGKPRELPANATMPAKPGIQVVCGRGRFQII